MPWRATGPPPPHPRPETLRPRPAPTSSPPPRRPVIVCATAVDLLRGYGPTAASAAIRATKDEDPVVRGAAVSGLERLPPRERLATAAPLLQDAIRAVRIEAARVLATVPAELFDAPPGRACDPAPAEPQ